MKISRTKNDNVKVLMDQEEALALARLMNCSQDAVQKERSTDNYSQEDEDLISSSLFWGLDETGVRI